MNTPQLLVFIREHDNLLEHSATDQISTPELKIVVFVDSHLRQENGQDPFICHLLGDPTDSVLRRATDRLCMISNNMRPLRIVNRDDKYSFEHGIPRYHPETQIAAE
jgi:hypothetical protein